MMSTKVMIVFVMLILLFSGAAYGAGMARPMGMGGAFIAISDDINGIFENPAGLAYGKGQELGFYLSFLNDSTAAGAGYRYTFGSSDAVGVAVMRSVFSSFYSDYQDRYLYLAYSHKFADSFSLGVNLNGEQVKFSGISTLEGQGYAADIGLMYVPNPNFSFGLVLENAVRTDFYFTNGTEYSVDRYVDGGIAWKPYGSEALIFAADLNWVVETFVYSFGVEGRPMDFLVLRGGVSGATSELSKRSFFAGLGFNIGQGLFFDLAAGADSTTGSFSWLF